MVVTLIVAYIAIRKCAGRSRGKSHAGNGNFAICAARNNYCLGDDPIFHATLADCRTAELYGTFGVLLIAYIARFLNLGYNNIAGAIESDRSVA